MKRLVFLFCLIVSLFSFSQEYDFQEMCITCAEANGYYCGDDPANWTQYAPMGCVQEEWINDGWEDCVDAGDENGSAPTSPEDCAPPPQECDTVYVEVPLIQYEYIYQIDTITEIEIVIQTETEYIYVTDTVYADVLDTMYIDVIEYVEIFVIDTLIQIEYMPEYIDCDSGLPCNSGMEEILDKSINTGLLYNLNGKAIRQPEGIYIENGKIKYLLK